MADGYLNFDTKIDTSGFEAGLLKVGGIAKKGAEVLAAATTAVVAGITAASAAAIKFGSEYESAFTKSSTLFGDVAVDTDNLNKKILAMSDSTGVAASELQNTLYEAMSSGIPVTEDMGQALDAVSTATKLSIAGFTDSGTAIDVLTTAINAYGMSASDASKIADELVVVQNAGKTTVNELASQMGRAISTASAYGVSLENVNAGYITLTNQGIDTAESTTYLASMFNELGDSGSQVGKILKEKTGMSFSQMMQNGYSLADVMDILSQSVNGDKSALMNLWSSQEAGKASNAILTAGTDSFRKSLDDLANSAGTTENAYDKMSETFDTKKNKVIESTKNLGIEIYNSMLQGVGSNMLDVANQYIGQLTEGFEGGGVDGLVSAAGNVLSDAVAKISENAPQMVELAVSLIQTFVSGIDENLPTIEAGAVEILSTLANGIVELLPVLGNIAYDIIISLLNGIVENGPSMMQSGSYMLSSLVLGIVNGLAQIANVAFSIITQFVTSIAYALPEIIPAALNIILTLVNSLLEHLPDIVTTGIQLLVGLINGIINCIPQLIAEIPQIIKVLVETLIQNIPELIVAGIQLLLGLASGLIQAIPQLIICIPEIILAIFQAFADADWGQIGKNILDGIAAGIQNFAYGLYSTAKNVVGGVVDSVKDFLGIHSPSRKMRDEVGKYMAEGVNVGFEDNISADDMNSSLDDVMTNLQANVASVGYDIPVTSSTEYYSSMAINNNTEIDYDKMASAMEKTNITVTGQSNITVEMNEKEVGKAVAPIVSQELADNIKRRR